MSEKRNKLVLFGELENGDRFAWHGAYWTKLSKHTAKADKYEASNYFSEKITVTKMEKA
jgi:hypothetical protein